MKKFVILIAIALLLKPVFPVIEYVLNYDYIAKNLCVNIAKPQMHCNGKCHLMKELAKAAEAEKPVSSDKKSNAKSSVEELFFQAIQPIATTEVNAFIQKGVKVLYNNCYRYQSDSSVFHPPTV